MGFLWFGRKKRKAAQKTIDSFQRDIAISERFMKEEQAFRKSASGKLVDRHFALGEQLTKVSTGRQVKIAQEMVSFAPAAAKALLQRYEMDAKQARALKIPTRPVRLPGHAGFERLAINFERDKRYPEALAVCRQAQGQGWDGDWEKRIERIETKMSKTKG